MGITDFMYSSTDYLKRNAPDLTPVMNACWSSYGYGWTAVNAVRDNVVWGVNKYYPDKETQAKTVRIATKIGQNAANYAFQETLKSIPGRNAFDKIVLPAIRDEMAPQAKMSRAEKDTSGYGKSLEPAKIFEGDKEFASENALPLDLSANQKPEDVMRIFMMNGFMGRNTFDALMVPVTRRGKNQEKTVSDIEDEYK